MTTLSFPQQNQPFVDQNGNLTPSALIILTQAIERICEMEAEIASLEARVTALETP